MTLEIRAASSRCSAIVTPVGAPGPSAVAESCFSKLVEHGSDVIALLDAGGTILYASASIRGLAGYSAEEVVGRRALDAVHPEDLTACLASLNVIVSHPEAPGRLVFRARHKDGTWLSIEAVGVNRLDDPTIRAVVVNFHDVTEREQLRSDLRQARALLNRNESQYHALVEQAADAILVTDAYGHLVDANQAACDLTGYSREELLRLDITDTYPPEDRQAAMHRIRALPQGERLLAERRLRRRDGSELTVEITLKRLVDGRVQGILRDVAERREVEEHLRWLTLATEQSPASVIMTNPDGVIEYVNPGFTAMTGYASAEVIGKKPQVLKSGLTRAEEYQRLWATITSGRVWRGELCNRRKDGRLYWHSASIAPIKNADGQIAHFLAVQQDITDRVETEAALREREARLRGLIESNILGIGFWDASGGVTEANGEYLRITGYTREDLAAGLINFHAMTPPEHDSANTRALELMAKGEAVPPWEKELLRKNGQRVPVVVGVAPLNERRDQGVVFLLDITERRALERQLRQAQKMEAVGRLAGGVAHDFNNILTAITGYSDMLREDLTPGHPGHEDVAEIRKAADRAVGLTRQLLAFSRQQVLEPRVLDLNDLTRNLEKMLRRLMGEDMQLVTRLAPALGAVKADPGQLEQVLMNLAVNGRDAMPEGGELTIETGDAEVDTAYAAEHPGLSPGRYVTLAVRDTGTGMDPITKSRLFEPFFTTKEKGKGTGLGLSTVYGIVKQSDGFIDVVSEPGQGAVFTVYLPRVDERAETLAAGDAAPSPHRGAETILLAEDDPGVRKIVREALVRCGYTVLAAQNGSEALRMAAGYPGAIGLLVTDIVMPEMGGRDLATQLAATRPHLRVLYMSGYTDDEVLRRGIIERSRAYLKKPFSPELLLRKVQAVLEAPV